MATKTLAPPRSVSHNETATKLTPLDIIRPAATAKAKARGEAVEVIHSCFIAMDHGESFDSEDLANALNELQLTEADVLSHYEAHKSAPNIGGFDADHKRRLNEANAITAANNLRLQEEKRLEWVAMVNKYNAGSAQVRTLIQEQQQVRVFRALNPFLFDDLQAAAAAANVPGITMSEAAQISEDRFPGPAADKLRRDKLALRGHGPAVSSNPNAMIGKTSCDLPMDRAPSAGYVLR